MEQIYYFIIIQKYIGIYKDLEFPLNIGTIYFVGIVYFQGYFQNNLVVLSYYHED